MGERKVLNKYYPPDFDPAKIPRRRQPKNQQIKVRMMLPMSIRCNTCGNYIYKGTKFNSRKEDVVGETYLGIQIFRFYFKCTRCSAELTMKTDPQNSDYTVEAGATRNFEPWRAEDEAVDDAKKKRDAEEMGDAMKALENRTVDSKREMDILTALDEMKSMRARHASVGPEELLEAIRRTSELKEKKLAEQDEALIRSVVFQNSQSFVHRLDDDEDDEDDEDDIATGSSSKRTKFEPKAGGPSVTEHLTEQISSDQTKATADITKARFGIRPQNVAFHIKPKKAISTRTEEEPHVEPSGGQSSSNCNASRTGLDSLVATYDSDSSD